jgi:hypothetical protein
MSNWPYSVVLLIPAAVQAAGNQVAEGLGHGPHNFSVALSSDGSEPATYYGCRTQAQQSFIDLLTAAGEGTLPEIEGMTPQEVGTVLMQLQADVSTSEDGYTHFQRVIAEKNVMRVVPNETTF